MNKITIDSETLQEELYHFFGEANNQTEDKLDKNTEAKSIFNFVKNLCKKSTVKSEKQKIRNQLSLLKRIFIATNMRIYNIAAQQYNDTISEKGSFVKGKSKEGLKPEHAACYRTILETYFYNLERLIVKLDRSNYGLFKTYIDHPAIVTPKAHLANLNSRSIKTIFNYIDRISKKIGFIQPSENNNSKSPSLIKITSPLLLNTKKLNTSFSFFYEINEKNLPLILERILKDIKNTESLRDKYNLVCNQTAGKNTQKPIQSDKTKSIEKEIIINNFENNKTKSIFERDKVRAGKQFKEKLLAIFTEWKLNYKDELSMDKYIFKMFSIAEDRKELINIFNIYCERLNIFKHWIKKTGFNIDRFNPLIFLTNQNPKINFNKTSELLKNIQQSRKEKNNYKKIISFVYKLVTSMFIKQKEERTYCYKAKKLIKKIINYRTEELNVSLFEKRKNELKEKLDKTRSLSLDEKKNIFDLFKSAVQYNCESSLIA